MKSNCMPLHSLSAKHNSKWKGHILQHRTLLDMQFQIRSRTDTFLLRIADPFNIDIAPAKSLF